MEHNDGVNILSKEKIIVVLSALVPQAKIYLYGSRALGTHRQWSDIDLALDAGTKLDAGIVEEAKEVLEALRTPYRYDVIDLNGVSDKFRAIVMRDKKIWKA